MNEQMLTNPAVQVKLITRVHAGRQGQDVRVSRGRKTKTKRKNEKVRTGERI